MAMVGGPAAIGNAIFNATGRVSGRSRSRSTRCSPSDARRNGEQAVCEGAAACCVDTRGRPGARRDSGRGPDQLRAEAADPLAKAKLYAGLATST